MVEDASFGGRWLTCGFIHAAEVALYRRELLINDLVWKGRLGGAYIGRHVHILCLHCLYGSMIPTEGMKA